MPKILYGITELCDFDLQGRFGVFVNLLLYEECFYIECISFWHILYKLKASYLKATTLSEGYSQILQPRFGTSKGKYGGVLNKQSLQGQITNYE